jgi:hypothetical protein
MTSIIKGCVGVGVGVGVSVAVGVGGDSGRLGVQVGVRVRVGVEVTVGVAVRLGVSVGLRVAVDADEMAVENEASWGWPQAAIRNAPRISKHRVRKNRGRLSHKGRAFVMSSFIIE